MIDLFFSWYFIDFPKQAKHIWVNYLWFFEKYFALRELIHDFASPWKGLYFERESVGFDFGEMFYVWFSNAFSRGVGMLIRAIALLIGTIFMLFVFLAGAVFFLAWAMFLFALVFAFFKGFQLLISLPGK